MYADKGGSKFILTDTGGQLSSDVLHCRSVGLQKVYTSPYSPKSNTIIEKCHSLLKNPTSKNEVQS